MASGGCTASSRRCRARPAHPPSIATGPVAPPLTASAETFGDVCAVDGLPVAARAPHPQAPSVLARDRALRARSATTRLSAPPGMVSIMFDGLHDIDWASMKHAYGSAGDVPTLLWALRSPDVTRTVCTRPCPGRMMMARQTVESTFRSHVLAPFADCRAGLGRSDGVIHPQHGVHPGEGEHALQMRRHTGQHQHGPGVPGPPCSSCPVLVRRGVDGRCVRPSLVSWSVAAGPAGG